MRARSRAGDRIVAEPRCGYPGNRRVPDCTASLAALRDTGSV